jgi:Tfp pilus assembly protein PilV
MILSKTSGQSGSSLIEATIAACCSALFLASLFTMNMTAMRTMRTAREAANASQVLQQRVEAMRIANWHQITDADWVKTNLLATNAAGSDSLKNMTETLTLVPYGSSSTANTQITRTGGSTQIVSRNTNLLTEHAMKVIWTVAYNGGTQGQSTTRQTVAILAKGGVAKW